MRKRFSITLLASLLALCMQAFAGVELGVESWFDGR